MRQSKAGRPNTGGKYDVRLSPAIAAAVADYAEARWPGNKHAGAYARRELIADAIYAYQEANRIMSIVNIVILNTTTKATGLEWGPALDHVPAIDTRQARRFLAKHDAWENAHTDIYALIVPEELWDTDLNGLPYLEIEVPQAQAQALIDELTHADRDRAQHFVLSQERPGGPENADEHGFVLRDESSTGDSLIDVYPGDVDDVDGAMEWATAKLAECGIDVKWTQDRAGRDADWPYWQAQLAPVTTSD